MRTSSLSAAAWWGLALTFGLQRQTLDALIMDEDGVAFRGDRLGQQETVLERVVIGDCDHVITVNPRPAFD